MKYLDFTLTTPVENLTCDEALLDLAEAGAGGEILRFWEPRGVFVVIGYANHAAREVNLPACESAGIPVFRRCTGGGTVLQGTGCLNYTLILRISEAGPLTSITTANQFILQRNQLALEPLLKRPVRIQGQTDLSVGNRKFSGNAQRRKRDFLIFHGTFLLNFDLQLIAKYLPMPSKQPDYREKRSHVDFLTNLNVAAGDVKEALRIAWGANEESVRPPADAIGKLVREKYSLAEWNLKF
jgi:lipoate-protein ligase A